MELLTLLRLWPPFSAGAGAEYEAAWYDNEDCVARRIVDITIGRLHTLVFHPAVALARTIAPAEGTDVSSITVLGITGNTDLGARVKKVRMAQRPQEGKLRMEVDIIEPQAYGS